jgi:hypothetical protein
MTNLQQAILLGALLFWAALLFGGFIFGKPWADGSRRMPVWTRMGSSLMLVVAAWTFYTLASGSFDTPSRTLALCVALGMTAGFIGDLFMARLIIKGDLHVLGGIGAFSVGHTAYIVGMVQYAGGRGVALSLWVLVVWWAAGLIGWVVVVWLAREKTVLNYAALPYTLLLSSTAGVASALALGNMGSSTAFNPFIITAIGAALFLLSDLILAARLFRQAYFPLIDDLVWLTYGPGQMLIVYSLGVLLPLIPFRFGGLY